MPSMVTEVSAILVDRTTFFLPNGALSKTFSCSSFGSRPYSGTMCILLWKVDSTRRCMQVFMIFSPGRKTRMSPSSLLSSTRSMVSSILVMRASVAVSVIVLAGIAGGSYTIVTGNTCVSIVTIGQPSKYVLNASAFIVAELTITLKSLRSASTRFKRPRTKSMFRLRSCASSTMTTEYLCIHGSSFISCKRMPSVMIFIRVVSSVLSSKRIL